VVRTFLPATLTAISSPLALVLALSASLGAAAQDPVPEPVTDLPVSLDRIREELANTPPARLKLDMPLDVPIATFRTRVEQRVFVLPFKEWLKEEFELNEFQRQSAEWAANSGGIIVASGATGIRLDPLFDRLEKALERRRIRKIREQIARELEELEAARKKAGLADKP
jgi:hypothetical protein